MVDCPNRRNKVKVRPRIRLTEEDEENLKIMGIQNRHTVQFPATGRKGVVL